MKQRFFYLDEEKQHCLTATWQHNWTNFRLRYRQEEVGSFATRKELMAGRHFVMADGHLLSVRLSNGLYPQLELLRDGQPLPDCKKITAQSIRLVSQLALFLGIINVVGGVAAALLQSEVMLSIGLGYGSAAVGGIYILLAWAARYFSAYALYAVAALVLLDMALLYVFTSGQDGPTSPTSGLLLKLFLLYAFIKVRSAMQKLATPHTATLPQKGLRRHDEDTRHY